MTDRRTVEASAKDAAITEALSAEVPEPRLVERVGRFAVQRLLGQGGFGSVFLALDEQLNRLVAVKVPHAEVVLQLEDAEAYLAEARTVARLDHPHIVPVYDVGSTPEFPCFIITKYIEGVDLATRLGQARFSVAEAAGLVATVAEALHHAHTHGFVHRDVKPGNILIDETGKPYIVDFGLALSEQNCARCLPVRGNSGLHEPRARSR